MKKILVVLLSSFALFSLISCNDTDSPEISSLEPVVSNTTSITPDETSSLEVSDAEEDFLESTSFSPETSSVEETQTSSFETSSSSAERTYDSRGDNSSSQKYYHVTFQNYDGTVLYEVDVLEDETAVYQGETPKRSSDGVYNYSFYGWDKELANINSDTTIVATYRATEIEWGTIHW